MTHRFYFMIALLLLPLMGKAQLNKELLLNGGFEEYAQSPTPPTDDDEDEGDEEEEEDKGSSILIRNHFFGISVTSLDTQE